MCKKTHSYTHLESLRDLRTVVVAAAAAAAAAVVVVVNNKKSTIIYSTIQTRMNIEHLLSIRTC